MRSAFVPCLAVLSLVLFLGTKVVLAQKVRTAVPISIDERIAAITPEFPIRPPEDTGGFLVQGFDFQREFESDTPDASGDDTVLQFGEVIDLTFYLKVLDRIHSPNVSISLSTGGIGKTFKIADFAGPGGMHIGGVYKNSLEFKAVFLPDRDVTLPFFEPRIVPITISIWNDLGGNLWRQQITALTVGPILDNPGRAFCLTGNEDIENTKRRDRIEAIGFPDGDPKINASGNGDIHSELTDGVFTGSGIPVWESIYWDGNWGTKTRRVDFALKQESQIDVVVAVFTSPYGNNWIDRLNVEISHDGELYEPWGEGDYILSRTYRGIHLLIARGAGRSTRRVRLILTQEEGASRIPLSEVYILGK